MCAKWLILRTQTCSAIKMCADLKELKDGIARSAFKLRIGTHDNTEEENDNDN